jgi:hypothetical protein
MPAPIFSMPVSFPTKNDDSQAVATTDVWLTPPSLIKVLGEFDLDPCACSEPRPWPTAGLHYVEAEDGLSRPWVGRVWCNPPYSDAKSWLKRLAEHGHGIALVFARTETAAFQDHVFPHASALLFIRGRLKFCRPDGIPGPSPAGAPSVLIAYGEGDSLVLRSAVESGAIEGTYVQLR